MQTRAVMAGPPIDFLVQSSLAQVWMRIYDLGCEFWEPELLSGIARAAGTPLKIDYNTLHGMFGLYARVLVEVDMALPLPEKLMLQRTNHSSFVHFAYESLPDFCTHCECIGHSFNNCRRAESLISRRACPNLKPIPSKSVVQPTRPAMHLHKLFGDDRMKNKFAALGNLENNVEVSFVADSQPAGKQNTQEPSSSFVENSLLEDHNISHGQNRRSNVLVTFQSSEKLLGNITEMNKLDGFPKSIMRKPVRHLHTHDTTMHLTSEVQKVNSNLDTEQNFHEFVVEDSFGSGKSDNMNFMAKQSWADEVDEEESKLKTKNTSEQGTLNIHQ